jgi:nitrogen fixation protein FixH
MKINWGHKLVFFGLSFMFFVAFMVYKITTQKVDLVDDNYYEKGVRYQEEINKFNATEGIERNISFDLNQQLITFKSNINSLKGKALFYRPGDVNLDFETDFTLNENGEFTYSTAQLAKGVWKVTFEWTLNGKLMAAEKQFVIE